MNKCFLFTAVLLFLTLVTGCQKDSDVLGGNTTSEPRTQINISLDGVGQSSETRAATTDIDLDAKGFTIAGYYTAGITSAVDGSVTTAGDFATQITTAVPNVFSLEEISSGNFHPAVRNLKKDATGKYHVLLSKWALLSESYLSYVAWSVATDAAVGAVGNPITSATAVGSVGRPFIAVAVDGKTDVVAASSIDNRNDVVRGAIDLDFKHIFSKLRFHAIAASDAATITITSAKLIANASVSKSARYDFNVYKDDYAGSWGAATSTTAATYPLDLAGSVAVTNAEAKFLDDRLVIPQVVNRGDFSVELTYTLANGSTTSTYTRTVALPAQTLLQNTSYTYTFTLSEDRIEVGTCNIGTWILQPTSIPPQVPGPRGDVILLLDASEPPYVMADGTRYWLDRSGYNNHAKVNGNTAYDPTLKCYTFSNTDAMRTAGHVTIPNLGDYSNGGVTVEMVAKTWVINTNLLISFTSFGNHFYSSYGGGTYFDAGRTVTNFGSRLSVKLPDAQSDIMALYSYSYNAGTESYQHIMRNMTKMAILGNENNTEKTLKMENGGLGNGASASISYFQVTKKAKRTIYLNECKALAKKFKFPVDSYVQDGLLMDLQGITQISTYKGKQVWLDNSINENHAEIINPTAAGITYEAATKSYILPGTTYGMFTAMKQIGDINNCTVEVVTKPENITNSLIFLGNPSLGGSVVDAQRVFHIHYPWNDNVAVNSSTRITVPIANLTYPKIYEQAAQLSIIRDASKSKMSLYQNSVFEGEVSVTTVLPAVNTVIGGQSDGTQPYKGRIYAVRIYNRPLTDAERAANYELDKKTYNLP